LKQLNRAILFITIVLATFTLQASELQKVSLQLQWKYQFQFAGFIMAKELGYYRDVGLDVDILEYNNTNSMKDLEDGKIDFAINNSMLAYQDKKLLDVTLLATYFQRSPLILVTQPDIDDVLKLKGKTVMMSDNNYYNSSLSILLEYFSINKKNTKFVPASFNLDDFISKKVDAVTAFKSNEIFELNQRKIPYNIIDPVEYGFSTNAINLFTSCKKLKDDPQMVDDFLQATKAGWKYALDHIDEVAMLIHTKYKPSKSFELLQYEGNITKELMLTDLYDIGEINENFILKTYRQLVKRGKIIPDVDHDIKKLMYIKSSQNRQLIQLSRQEKEWIKAHPVITYSEINWKPLSIIENNTMNGIMGDYLSLVSERTGITFKYIKSESWSEVLQKFKDKEIDMIPGAGSSPQELSLGSVTLPYASYPMVIVTNNRYNFLDSLEEFKDKTISVPKYYTSYNFITKNYPDIKLLTTKNIPQSLLNVQSGRAAAFVGHIATSLYYIAETNSIDLKVAGTTKFKFEHRFLIQNDYKILTDIINRVIRSISEKERNTINSNWIKTKVEKKMDYTLIYQLLLLILIIFLIFIWKQYTLKKYNTNLKELKDRMDLALAGNRDVIWDWNIKTDKLYVSNRWKDIVGIAHEDIPYEIKEWQKRIHPDDFKAVTRAIVENLQGRTKYLDVTHRIKHHDGHWVWIRIRGKTHYDKDGKPTRMTGTHTDITHERELQQKVTQQAQMIEQIHDSIIATDLDGIIISWNRGSEILLDYTAEEMIGKHITKIYLKEDIPILLKNIEILKERGDMHATIRLVKKSSEVIFVDLSLSVLRDENGVITSMVGYCQDITERKKAEDILIEQKNMLDYQAHHDALTGLPNRTLFLDRLHQGIAKAKRHNEKLALFFIDLDRFKQINDSLGHEIGDQVLNIVTKRLSSTIRQEDTLARLGGDEFTIIMESLKHSKDASILAEKILKILEDPIIIENHTLYISSSIGISVYPKDETDATNLLKDADAAMYRAKDEGRNNYQFYSQEMTEMAFERVVMETSIRQAIKNSEFVVYYQPQIDAKEKKVVGMEALVRWEHPMMGLVSPAKFIPLAEDTGLIVDIDQIVMRSAMSQLSRWHKDGLNPGTLSLNLAAKQLNEKGFITILKDAMEEFDFKPQWLELEITEGDVMKNPERAIIKLKEIYDLDINIAIDDFGTGYSSLSYLKKFPITKLKIDQSFVRDIPDDEEDSAIVKAIIALGKSLNLKLIAEGVEEKNQEDFLLQNGCQNIQGYFYSRPIPAKEMQEFLKRPL
jgi:diguanylate cyclase (GGDEF)-like protein/PAS domain S-box-containing protein